VLITKQNNVDREDCGFEPSRTISDTDTPARTWKGHPARSLRLRSRRVIADRPNLPKSVVRRGTAVETLRAPQLS
jgi:hypothetical protein